jgi:microcystin degradation protein MlrC
MRVGIIALQHESNTFMPRATTFEDFARHSLHRGEAIRAAYQAAHHEVGGLFEGLATERIDAVPIFAARAVPSGTITAECLEQLLKTMFDDLAAAGPLDGLLVAPHGAGVSEPEHDMDGHWLSLLRRHVGAAMPMICTLDPHANLTPRMVDACTATIAYRSNPHLDQRARGVEAARLMARTLRGEVKPTQAAVFPPIAINIERQLTAAPPARDLFAKADEIARRPGVLSDSIFLGFPYADVPEMGSAALVVTDDAPAKARALAGELGGILWGMRGEFVGVLTPIDEAITRALTSPKPVCLLDMGDNVGGGSPADGTLLAHALHAQRINAFVCLFDPPAVAAASAAGVGNRVRLEMGGHTDPLHGQPLTADVTVVSLHAGQYAEPQPRHGGNANYNIGPTAIVRTDTGLTLQLTSRRAMPSSLNQLLSCNLDPKSFDIIVAKGVHAPVAAYAPVCPTLIRVNTPGITTADMNALTYRNRRRPLFPFETSGF